MNVLIAPNAFKETLTAFEAARALRRGVGRALPRARVRLVPIADGGDGTAEILTKAAGGVFFRARMPGPLGVSVAARGGWLPARRTAFIDVAEASGLKRVPVKARDPLRASTDGTGLLIRAALDRGARRIVLGLGGSAAVDGGMGLARALGVRFLDGAGRALAGGGGDLVRLRRIDLSGLDPRLRAVDVRAACDVLNPLLGPAGASRVFAPQKGASSAEVVHLERGLARFAVLVRRATGRDVARLPGAGAAGGLGAGLAALLGAGLEPGAALVFSEIGMASHLKWADVVLTGEGRAEAQTLMGKAPGALAALARRAKKRVLFFAGSFGPGAEALMAEGAALVRTTEPWIFGEDALREAADRLARAAEDSMRRYFGREKG